MIEHIDAEDLSGVNESSREEEIFGRRCGIARAVVVEDDERRCVLVERNRRTSRVETMALVSVPT